MGLHSCLVRIPAGFTAPSVYQMQIPPGLESLVNPKFAENWLGALKAMYNEEFRDMVLRYIVADISSK